MKYNTTKKVINANYAKKIKIGYCELENLLDCEDPTAYTCGTLGHNADVYDFGDVAIITGYRPFGNFEPDRKIIEKFENKAIKLRTDGRIDLLDTKQQLKTLINEFIACVVNG